MKSLLKINFIFSFFDYRKKFNLIYIEDRIFKANMLCRYIYFIFFNV